MGDELQLYNGYSLADGEWLAVLYIYPFELLIKCILFSFIIFRLNGTLLNVTCNKSSIFMFIEFIHSMKGASQMTWNWRKKLFTLLDFRRIS